MPSFWMYIRREYVSKPQTLPDYTDVYGLGLMSNRRDCYELMCSGGFVKDGFVHIPVHSNAQAPYTRWTIIIVQCMYVFWFEAVLCCHPATTKLLEFCNCVSRDTWWVKEGQVPPGEYKKYKKNILFIWSNRVCTSSNEWGYSKHHMVTPLMSHLYDINPLTAGVAYILVFIFY